MSARLPFIAEYDAASHGRRHPGLRVREAAGPDAEPIALLQTSLGPTPAARAVIEAAIGDPSRLVVVATVDDELVGWAKTHRWTVDDGPALAGHYLGGVTVHPSRRRRGAATMLTHARMSWIAERAACAWYVVNARNAASVDLHRAWDFREITRADRFHSTTFTGGVGVLLRAELT